LRHEGRSRMTRWPPRVTTRRRAAGCAKSPELSSVSGPDEGHPEAQTGAAVADLSPGPCRRQAKGSRVMPAPAPVDPPRGRRFFQRVRAPAGRCREAVAAPLRDVAVHVVQAPAVRGVPADRRRLAAIRPGGRAVVGLRTVEVGLLAAQPISEGRGRRGPGAAGELPLRLGREPVLPPRLEPARPTLELG
jgi:hypothetical protein